MCKESYILLLLRRDGGVKKGILMPANWMPSSDLNSTDNYVNVPIYKALPIIKNSSNGASTRTNTSLSFQRVIQDWNGLNYLNVYIAASRKQGGSIYLDPKILKLVKDKLDSNVSRRHPCEWTTQWVVGCTKGIL